MKRVVAQRGDLKVIAMDSISYVDAADAGHIVVSASHGGASSAEYARTQPLAAVFFNDAGVGKDKAGIAARNFNSRITTSLKSGMLEVVNWKSCVSARAQWMCRSRVRRMGPSTLMPTWATR